MPGRLVLQDLPEVVEQARGMFLHPRIELMAHDFFTEQPIQGKLILLPFLADMANRIGARAYYMHSILHDWNDDNCRRILTTLVPAMKRATARS